MLSFSQFSDPALPRSCTLVLLGLLACGGGQTGDGDPIVGDGATDDPTDTIGGIDEEGGRSEDSDNGTGTGMEAPPAPTTVPNGESNDTACQYVRTLVADAATQTSLGFSAQEALGLDPLQLTTDLIWQGSPQLSFGPEAGSSTLRISVQRLGGKIMLRQSESPACPDALEIDALMTLQSEGGALNETFITTLIAPDASGAVFHQSLSADALSGRFQVLATTPVGGRLRQLIVRGQLSSQGTCGLVDAAIHFDAPVDSGPQLSALGTVARWPSTEPCDGLDTSSQE